MSSMMASSVFDENAMSSRYSFCRGLSVPKIGLASSSLNPMMLVSGVRSSYEMWPMNWFLSLSSVTSASLRSISARS